MERHVKKEGGVKKITDHLLNQLIKSLKNGKKCVVVSASKKRGAEYIENILLELPELRYKFYNSDNKKDAFESSKILSK